MIVGIDCQPDFAKGVARPLNHKKLVVFATPLRRTILLAVQVIEYPPGNNRGVFNIDFFTVCSQFAPHELETLVRMRAFGFGQMPYSTNSGHGRKPWAAPLPRPPATLDFRRWSPPPRRGAAASAYYSRGLRRKD